MRHLLIAGTGRAGTTLLVELLGELGLDTGRHGLAYYDDANAGLEARLNDPRSPYVVKDPQVELHRMIASGAVDPGSIDVLVVPIRDLDQATLSRLHRSSRSLLINAPGGVAYTRRPWKQRAVLAERLHRLLETAAENEIPVKLLSYPRFALDPDYAYRQLAPLAGCGRDHFFAAWHEVIDPDLVRPEPLRPSLAMCLRLGAAVLHGEIRRPVARLVRVRRQRQPSVP